MQRWMVALFLLTAITLGAFGQISLKHGMKMFGSLGPVGLSMAPNVLRAIFTPYVLLGLSLYAVSSGFWLVVISPGGWNLSYAYPMIATNYLLVVLLSRVFFKETVVPLQWMGIVFMVTGLVLVSYFGASKG